MKVEIIAGQIFIAMTGADGRKRTLPPLAAITETRAVIHTLQSERTAIEAEAATIVTGMRQSLTDGTDTSAHRMRMAELKNLDAELNTRINTANEQINHIRAATTRVEAEGIAAAVQAEIDDILKPLDTGAFA